MSLAYIRLIAVAGAFAFGLWVSYSFTAAAYKADIAELERDHAADMADQVSMANDLMEESLLERDRREKAFRDALQLLNERNKAREKELQASIERLSELEKSDEKVRDVGNIPTPDVIVDWLR